MDDRERLSRYLEGELGEDEQRVLEARLATDPGLARELEALRGLVAAAASLPRTVDPPPATWNAIRERLEIGGAGGRRARAMPALAAAGVAIVVLAGGFLLGRLDPGNSPVPPVARLPEAPAAAGGGAVPTEEEWDDTAQQVFAARDAILPASDPESEDVLRRNLEIVEEAVHRLHAALEEDPSNASLQRLLNAEYRRRGALLRRAAQDASVRT